MTENQPGKLVEYFKKNFAKGYTEESLKWALIQQGYSRSEISKAIEKAKKETEAERNEKEASKEKPKIKYELYGKDNKIINIETRKPFSFRKFFRKFFA